MRTLIAAASLAATFMLQPAAMAAAKPKNATAQCNDGTYSSAKTEQGACSRHGGVQKWFGETTTTSTTTRVAKTTAVRAVPRNATARCNDGTFSTAKTRQGACARHGGVQTWYAGEETTSVPMPAPAAVPAPAPVPTTSARTVPSPPMASNTASPQNATAKCKDGTLSFAKTHRGACSHHGGVAEWYK